MNFANQLNKTAPIYQALRQDKKVIEVLTNSISILLKEQISLNDIPALLKKIDTIDFKNDYEQYLLINNLTELAQAKELEESIIPIAEQLINTIHRTRASFTNEQTQLRSLAQLHKFTSLYLEKIDLNKNPKRAFQIAASNKAVLLLEATESKDAYQINNVPAPLLRKEQELQKQLNNLIAKKLNGDKQLNISKDISRIHLSIDSFKQKLATDYPEYIATKYRQKEFDIKELRATLSPNSLFMEYYMSDSAIFLFLINQQETYAYRLNVSPAKLSRNIALYHNQLSNYSYIQNNPQKAYKKYTTLAHWFYRALMAPANEIIEKHEHLIIATDRELAYIPFETFLTAPAPQKSTAYSDLPYVLKKHPISYGQTAPLWIKMHQGTTRNNNKKLLAVAANYTASPTSGTLLNRSPLQQNLRASLSPLPSARKEVQTLQENFSGNFLYDAAASESNFKETAPNYSVIHLAMHGFLNPKSPALSALAFTETTDSTEDNFLHAYEISKLPLNADLVVLSACETGFGKVQRGNGIASLARAFMYSGTPSLIVSLWQVNDYSTASIMNNLYENLAANTTKSKALQVAKLNYIETHSDLSAHPAFWSPFIQIGKDAPISLASNHRAIKWWYFLIGGLIFFIGFKTLRKKA